MEDLSEKEQLEKMRAWWSDYGAYVISGIVLGAIVLVGINYYQSSQREAEYKASSLYDALADHVVDGRVDEAEAVVMELEAEYGGSAYASQARLAMARLYMDKNRDQDAADILGEMIDSGASDEFKHVARVRLAKILLYQDKAGEVVALLDSQPQEGAFAARYAEALGDAYVVLGELGQAREAYQRALGEPNQAATVDQQFVQLKLMDLPLEVFAEAETDDVVESDAAEGDMSKDDAAGDDDQVEAPEADAANEEAE